MCMNFANLAQYDTAKIQLEIARATSYAEAFHLLGMASSGAEFQVNAEKLERELKRRRRAKVAS